MRTPRVLPRLKLIHVQRFLWAVVFLCGLSRLLPEAISFRMPTRQDPAMKVEAGIRDDNQIRSHKRPHRLSSTEQAEGTGVDLKNAPLFTIGVLADIQHADIDDGYSFTGTPRYYRHALDATRIAAQHFQSCGVRLVLNLGDMIDGRCQEAGKDGGRLAVERVMAALSAYHHGRILHTYGNHELYNLSREEIEELLNIPFVREEDDELVGYYTYKVDKFCFIMLDTYDVSIMGRSSQTSLKRKEAERLLSIHNPNFPTLGNSPEGMEGTSRRYVAFNGGVDEQQLLWLSETLETAKSNNERAIIVSHQPILPGSSNPVCLVWNYSDILDILRQYSGTVIASFAGHAHRGGYSRDEISGIHFRVFEAVLESRPPHKTYGLVDFYDNYLEVRGEGECQSAHYDFPRAIH